MYGIDNLNKLVQHHSVLKQSGAAPLAGWMSCVSGFLVLLADHQGGRMLRRYLFLQVAESLALQLNPEPSHHLEVGRHHHHHPFVWQPARRAR
jgi:hypothetical protein